MVQICHRSSRLNRRNQSLIAASDHGAILEIAYDHSIHTNTSGVAVLAFFDSNSNTTKAVGRSRCSDETTSQCDPSTTTRYEEIYLPERIKKWDGYGKQIETRVYKINDYPILYFWDFVKCNLASPVP